MNFSSVLFVFAFLPLVLSVYFVVRPSLRNVWLLIASLVFYAWGEPVIVLVMLASIVANWAFGLWVDRARTVGGGRGVVALAVVFNLGLLVFFKYTDWLWSGASEALLALGWRNDDLPTIGSLFERGSNLHTILLDDRGQIRLPIGISFFTFQAFSYVIDVYRRDGRVQRNLFDVALYVALFPQLIAGPIVRYRDVAEQIVHRVVNLEGFALGVRRFIIGLGKKTLIANVCAQCADQIFGGNNSGFVGVAMGEMTTAVAWLGIVAYTLQIYFDFSGYSDMAIGLGHMFGFTFKENFAYPYIARSITDFWRRWHISLSTWFRDYLYIPLGGNRSGKGRTYLNLIVVFFLCGLWHGANLTFLVWGLYHGVFLVLERIGLQSFLERRMRWLSHAYLLLVVMVGWVFFRANTLEQAALYIGAMFGFPSGSQLVTAGELVVSASDVHHVGLYASSLTWFAIACGCVGSVPWIPAVVDWYRSRVAAGNRLSPAVLEVAAVAGLAIVFARSAMELAAGAYNPFIYFRF